MTNGPETSPPAASAYIAAVRDELGDLPPAQAADILEDVREHITQVAQEYGEGVGLAELIDRLGPPATYVAELRAAAGIAATPPAPQRAGFGRRLLRVLTVVFGAATVGFTVLAVVDAVFSVSGAPAMFGVPAAICFVLAGASLMFLVLHRDDPAAELRQLPGARWLSERAQQLQATSWGPGIIDFVRSLQPGWWLARAAILGALVASATSVPLGAFVFVVATVGSVHLGLATAAGRRPGRRSIAVYGLNAAIVAGGLFGVLVLAQSLHLGYIDRTAPVSADGFEYDDGFGYAGGAEFGVPDAGMAATNIFAYDADGALIDHVRLYDQDGRPLVLPGAEPCYEGAPAGETFVVANPWGTNVYPRFVVEADQFGHCDPAAPEPPYGSKLPTTVDEGDVAATPAPTSTTEPTPTPTGGTSIPVK